MMKSHRILSLAICIGLCSTGIVAADVVTDWNNVTLDTIRAARSNPPYATRVLAMVHTAIFDAVNGIEGGGYTPYHVTRPAPRGASVEAAAAVAAHTVLLDLYPDRRAELHAALSDSLGFAHGGGGYGAWRKGVAYGRFVGRQILSLRAEDGSDAIVPYAPSGEFGYWAPTPPGFAPALLPQWPYVKPFGMTHGAQFRVPQPPPFDSPEYAEAFNEVRLLGDGVGSARSAEQTQIAFFWEDGPGTATPPGHWQVIAQQIAEMVGNGLVENARLFALLSIIQADAAIASWDNKYHYDHLRPYTAIVFEADDDGNPDTVADPGWVSLIPQPPFPSYTSGHSTFSGSSAQILASFVGTDAVSFCAPSPDPQRWPDYLTDVVRCWDSFSQAAEEAGQSRIYGGIHWQYDNQRGLSCGRDLAEHVFNNFLTPRGDDDGRPGDGDDDDDDDDGGRPGDGDDDDDDDSWPPGAGHGRFRG